MAGLQALESLNRILASDAAKDRSDKELALNVINLELQEKERQAQENRFQIDRRDKQREQAYNKVIAMTGELSKYGVIIENDEKKKKDAEKNGSQVVSTDSIRLASTRMDEINETMESDLSYIDKLDNEITGYQDNLKVLTNELAKVQVASAFAGQRFNEFSETDENNSISGRSAMSEVELDGLRKAFELEFKVKPTKNQLIAIRKITTSFGRDSLQDIKHKQLMAEEDLKQRGIDLGVKFNNAKRKAGAETLETSKDLWGEKLRTSGQNINSTAIAMNLDSAIKVNIPNRGDTLFDPNQAEMSLATALLETAGNTGLYKFLGGTVADVPDAFEEALEVFEGAGDQPTREIAAKALYLEMVKAPHLIRKIDVSSVPFASQDTEKRYFESLVGHIELLHQANADSELTRLFTKVPDYSEQVAASLQTPGEMTKQERASYDKYVKLHNKQKEAQKSETQKELNKALNNRHGE